MRKHPTAPPGAAESLNLFNANLDQADANERGARRRNFAQ